MSFLCMGRPKNKAFDYYDAVYSCVFFVSFFQPVSKAKVKREQCFNMKAADRIHVKRLRVKYLWKLEECLCDKSCLYVDDMHLSKLKSLSCHAGAQLKMHPV